MTDHVIELAVQGPLRPSLVAALEGFTIGPCTDGVTVIVGPVLDQAHLLGLLDMFDAVNVEIISVNSARPGAERAATPG